MPERERPDPPRPGDDPAVFERLGRAIQVLRAELGLSRKELASRARLSYSYVSEIEVGKKEPSSKTVFVLARALGVSPSELMAAAEERVRSPAPTLRDEWDTDAAPIMLAAVEVERGPSERALASRVKDPGQTSESRGRASPPQSQRPGASAEFRQDRKALIEILERLDPEDRELLIEFARRLVR